MKKLHFILSTKKSCVYVLFASLLLLFSSCAERKVKSLVEDFADAVNKGDKTAILHMYPDAANADSLALTYNADSVSVEEKEGAYQVTLSGGAKMVVAKDEKSGDFIIKESYGVFAYPAERLTFAKQTGWYDVTLTDRENAERLADEGFVDYLSGSVVADVRQKVYAKATSEIKAAIHGATYEIEVRNDNDFDLPGDAYVVTAVLWAFDFESLEFRKTKINNQYSGNTVPSHGSCRYLIPGDIDFEYEEWKVSIEITMPREQIITRLLKPTGHEYADYLSMKDTAGALVLNLNGKIGSSNDASFVINGPMGEGVASFTAGSGRVQRKLKLESYDKTTGKLVVQEFLSDGDYVGDFVGTYLNGVYSGTFTNKVRGAQVQFKLQ